MRLSEWRAGASSRDSMTGKVLGVVEPVLEDLGAEPDPHCWVYWGEDPALRYSIMVPTAPGLIMCHVRVNVPQEGPRASGKLVRWNRVQVGDLAIETQGGHRLVSVQVEGMVIKGVDAEADRIATFVLALFAAIDGRPIPDLGPRSKRGATGPKGAQARVAPAKPAGAKAAPVPKARAARR